MNKVDILIISGGNSPSVATNLNKLIRILSKFTDRLSLITYCNKENVDLNKENIIQMHEDENSLKQIVFGQFRVAKTISILANTNKIRTILFVFGQDLQIIPLLVTKMFGIKVIIRSDGRPSMVLKHKSLFIRLFYKVIETINYRASDFLLAESDFMISKYEYNHANICNGSLYVDLDYFKCNKKISRRKYDVGFVGRLEEEKGVMQLMKALQLVDNNLEVLIIGDGSQRAKLLEYINRINKRITYMDWVHNYELPYYLNDIKFLMMPSYKEGLPNILLEAMACGCIVLATTVGGIPGIIKDKNTGVLMEDNTPECICKHLVEIICSSESDLNNIQNNAVNLIHNHFSFSCVLERWKKIIDPLL